jgi:ribosomal protein L21E
MTFKPTYEAGDKVRVASVPPEWNPSEKEFYLGKIGTVISRAYTPDAYRVAIPEAVREGHPHTIWFYRELEFVPDEESGGE